MMRLIRAKRNGRSAGETGARCQHAQLVTQLRKNNYLRYLYWLEAQDRRYGGDPDAMG